jgi:hypothetical protein
MGITAEQFVGQSLDEETTTVLAESTIRIFSQRSLGAPFRDYMSFVGIR